MRRSYRRSKKEKVCIGLGASPLNSLAHRPLFFGSSQAAGEHIEFAIAPDAFRSFCFWGAWRTIAGYEAIHMIRKGQASGSVLAPRVGLLYRFILDLFAATN